MTLTVQFGIILFYVSIDASKCTSNWHVNPGNRSFELEVKQFNLFQHYPGNDIFPISHILPLRYGEHLSYFFKMLSTFDMTGLQLHWIIFSIIKSRKADAF